MNIRKNIDYSQMYQAIDDVMAGKLPQMQLYCAIGRIVCTRSGKGAAVMASEHIRAKHPEVQGFSPRNLRRMREFCRTYENHPAALSLAMELREWYLRAARIAAEAHLEIVLDVEQEKYKDDENVEERNCKAITLNVFCISIEFLCHSVRPRCRGRPKRGASSCPLLTCNCDGIDSASGLSAA